MDFRRTLLASVLFALSASAGAQRSAVEWRDLARQDLDAARMLILQAHPGAIDPLNPGLATWIEEGYREAAAMLPEVVDYDSMLAVVRYYVSGFRDGHLVYSDDLRNSDVPMTTTGWVVAWRQGKAVVAAVASDWKTPLPALGSELVACDGSTPLELMRERVAPYIHHRGFAHREAQLVQVMDTLRLRRHALQRCEFKSPEGHASTIEVGYQAISTDRYWKELVEPAAQAPIRRENSYTLADGVLWVGAHDFSLEPEQVQALDAMTAELASLEGFDTIAFDVRGNGGGDGSVGGKIFNAATGGLVFDREGIDALPRVHAQWRVSEVAIRSAREFVERRLEQYGADSPEMAYSRKHLASLEEAMASGEAWVEQPGGHRVDRAEFRRRNGRLGRFDGRIVLLTDHRCASACLDFADTVLLVPGAGHLGEETSGDSVYIDTARERLPSGNAFVIPLKVWRNRLRGNNETLEPDVPIALDGVDDATVRQRVLEAIRG